MGPVTETIFFPLKAGVDPTASLAAAGQLLAQQPGFKNAYHGPVVEDEKFHCVFIEWTDRGAFDVWAKSEDGESAKQGLLGIVDMEEGMGPSIFFTQFKHDVTKAVSANVTEFGFFSLPEDKATEDVVMSKIIGDMEDMEDHPVITVGKATGAACGFVFNAVSQKAEEGHKIVFTGVFGYNSVDQHWKWRDTPEHAEVIKGMDVLVNELDLKAVDVLGEERAMFKGSGMLHVNLTKLGS